MRARVREVYLPLPFRQGAGSKRATVCSKSGGTEWMGKRERGGARRGGEGEKARGVKSAGEWPLSRGLAIDHA